MKKTLKPSRPLPADGEVTIVMNIYVAGPMRDIPYFNFPAFDEAAARLREAGLTVFNPAERDRKIHGPYFNLSRTGSLADLDGTGFSLREALGADLAWITQEADAVVVLDGWENSKGANAEVATAKALGLPVMTVHEAIHPKFASGGIISSDAQPAEESPRASVLSEAKTLITGVRNNQYGPPTQDFQRTADMATAWGFKVGDQPLQSYHVAIFMILLKMSRLRWTPGKRDSWVDTGGYAGCGYECAVGDGESA